MQEYQVREVGRQHEQKEKQKEQEKTTLGVADVAQVVAFRRRRVRPLQKPTPRTPPTGALVELVAVTEQLPPLQQRQRLGSPSTEQLGVVQVLERRLGDVPLQ